ncbi:MAG: hypothetical protein ACRDFX_01910 [Chloroflexota bacterium]
MTSKFCRISLSVVAVCLILIAAVQGTARLSRATTSADGQGARRTATVFGRGPELHLLPNFGRVGTRVLVVGLGYPPRVRVNVYYGGLQAEFMPVPIVHAMTSTKGTFRTWFTVDCRFIALSTTHALHPPASCPTRTFRPIAIGGFVGHNFAHKKTAVVGLVVTG